MSSPPPAAFTPDATADASRLLGAAGAPDAPGPLPTPWRHRFPVAPVALAAVLFAFVLTPPVRDNPRLVWAFAGVSGAVLVWSLILWAVAGRRGRVFRVQYLPVKAHFVQAGVQTCILLYWGWYWREVYTELPLIVAQAVYFYALDALLSWSRGRTWRLGFGPLPIVISTNLLLWFRHDFYVFQFLMLTTGALAKQFITWEREGRRTHIFNPSAFGQFLFAAVLIGMGTTRDYTMGKEIAQFFEVPHMMVVIFLGGLVVQYLFHVTLMTVAATATIVLFNLAYTELTGVYYFVNINIAAPIFLGLHLLVTDPATSPRTNGGRVIFGVLYGLGYLVLFRVLDLNGVPTFWDKLLPVPILNLCVPLIDRLMRTGIIGRLNRAWETAMRPGRMNLVHMGLWAALFVAIEATGFVEGPHPGNSIPFWKQAYAEGKPYAGRGLVVAAGSQAVDGSGAAFNELGLICMEGEIVGKNHAAAAKHFADACALGDESGCVNVAIQFLFLREWLSDEIVARAFDLLEQDCVGGGSARSCYLVGFAYESGLGRPMDKARAIEFYERCGFDDLYAVKGMARVALSGVLTGYDVRPLLPALARAGQDGDAESCWYIAYMYRDGVGTPPSSEKARAMMGRACALGSQRACEVLQLPELPPYSDPVMSVPGLASAFPTP